MDRHSSKRWLNSILLVIVNLLWAAQYPAYKIAGDHMEAGALNVWTFVFATFFLLPFLLRERRNQPRLNRRLTRKALVSFTLLGLFGIVPPSVLLAWGIAHSSASNAAILSLTIPLLMTAMGAIFLGERITFLRAGTLALGLAGTVLVSLNDIQGASFSRTLLAGNLVVFLAGAGSAFYNAYGKELLQHFSELKILIYSYLSGGFFCACFSAFFEAKPFYYMAGYGATVWGAIAVLGLLSWGVAMVIWMWVLNRLDVGQISVSVYLLPFFGLLLSVFTLHERVAALQMIGGALVVVSTVILTAFDKPQGSVPATEAAADAPVEQARN